MMQSDRIETVSSAAYNSNCCMHDGTCAGLKGNASGAKKLGQSDPSYGAPMMNTTLELGRIPSRLS